MTAARSRDPDRVYTWTQVPPRACKRAYPRARHGVSQTRPSDGGHALDHQANAPSAGRVRGPPPASRVAVPPTAAARPSRRRRRHWRPRRHHRPPPAVSLQRRPITASAVAVGGRHHWLARLPAGRRWSGPLPPRPSSPPPAARHSPQARGRDERVAGAPAPARQRQEPPATKGPGRPLPWPNRRSSARRVPPSGSRRAPRAPASLVCTDGVQGRSFFIVDKGASRDRPRPSPTAACADPLGALWRHGSTWSAAAPRHLLHARIAS